MNLNFSRQNQPTLLLATHVVMFRSTKKKNSAGSSWVSKLI
ncbi:hypothetical protein HMPREF3213_03550 [Heyndrickxia coagulans]|uniref:Uncharacterized protein n=1 Tax=Heyndrickxia coagulans TaxID=1398 RepID=A0A133KBH5_HEYCO|nr:hypothetical protein HMPREF3213_03550 [Heyndrickxia coagulans]